MNLPADLRSLLPGAKVFAPGDGGLSDAEFAAYGVDRTAEFAGQADARALVLPATTDEVVRLVGFARERGVALVPSGGRTGLSGGAVARAGEVVVSLGRLNRVLEFLPHLPALRVEAGMILADLHAAAVDRGLLFPVDYASAGSVQVGGMIATNAGGVRVIRFGDTRARVLGLKVVAGTGDLLEFPGALLKNNSGYDLKQLIVGSEGTLGIVTEATLRLVAPPAPGAVVLCALSGFQQVLALLGAAREAGLPLLACECFDAACLDAVSAHLGAAAPFADPAPFYVLLELEGDSGAQAFESLLADRLLPEGIVSDALRAESSAARREFWSLREHISESLSSACTVHKNDVSLPPAAMPEFLSGLDALLAADRSIRPAVFGHVGDGNLHVNLIAPADMDSALFFDRCAALDLAIYSLIQRLGGSISAEHGIGLLKKKHLHFSRSPAELHLMRAIKSAFDPDNILNPGKVV